jgi:large subunit ribosomal protein L18
MEKKMTRQRRARRTRMKIRELGAHRLTVHRTPRHIYAQIIAPNGSVVVAAASTVERSVTEALAGYTGNIRFIAERAKAAGVEQVAFDRAGFKYHGRVKALADAAREHGLQF